MEESGTALGQSLQLTGLGDSYLDFAWQLPRPHSRGLVNEGQTVGTVNRTVPEPNSAIVWSMVGLLAIGIGKMFRSRRVMAEIASVAPS
jgi:hypothetical protein